MKNLVGYIFGFALCAFFLNCSFSVVNCKLWIIENKEGNFFSDTLFLLGLFCSFIGITTQVIKLIRK